MSRYTKRAREIITTTEAIADKLLPAEWRTRPDWPQLRRRAVREAARLVLAAELETRGRRLIA